MMGVMSGGFMSGHRFRGNLSKVLFYQYRRPVSENQASLTAFQFYIDSSICSYYCFMSDGYGWRSSAANWKGGRSACCTARHERSYVYIRRRRYCLGKRNQRISVHPSTYQSIKFISGNKAHKNRSET